MIYPKMVIGNNNKLNFVERYKFINISVYII
jgi:hypothetical protein